MKNLITALCLISSLYYQAQVPSYVPTNGLVGWWPFNGNANDESGNGNNGTVNGATLTTDRFGNINKAYSFDGSNFIELSSSVSIESIEINDQFTLSVWFNNQNPNINGVFSLLNKHNPISDKGWELFVAQNFMEFYLNDVGTIGYSPTNNCFPLIPANSWQHLVFSYNQQLQEGKLYLNGVLLCTIVINIDIPDTNSGSLYYGASFSGPDEYNVGKLDDIGIWNRALTEPEINALHASLNVGIDDLGNTYKKLLKITDLNGKSIPRLKNTLMLFIYEDGSVERVVEMEE